MITLVWLELFSKMLNAADLLLTAAALDSLR